MTSPLDRFASGRADSQDKALEYGLCDGAQCRCVIVHGDEVVIEDGFLFHSIDCYIKSNGARVGVYGWDIPA